MSFSSETLLTVKCDRCGHQSTARADCIEAFPHYCSLVAIGYTRMGITELPVKSGNLHLCSGCFDEFAAWAKLDALQSAA